MKYHKLVFLIILSSAIVSTVFSQSYYNTLYNYNGLQEFNTELDLWENDKFIQLGTARQLNSIRGIIIREIDSSNGELLWEDFITNDSLDLHINGHHTNVIIDSILCIIGTAFKIERKRVVYRMPYFIKYNLVERKLLNLKFYTDEMKGYAYSSVYKNGFIYGAGRKLLKRGFPEDDNLLLKLDVEGNLVWSKTYDFASDESIHEIEPLQDDLVAVGVQVNNINTAFIMKVDTNGNMLKKIELTDLGSAGPIKVETNNNAIYVMIAADLDLENYPTTYLAKYNNNLELQWDTLIPNTGKYYIEGRHMELLKDEIIIGANIYGAREFTNNQGWSHASSWSLDGQFNWEHLYNYNPNFGHHIDDVVGMPNGDLVFMGTVFDYDGEDIFTDQYLWLFRTDSQGCGTVQDTCYYTLDEYFGLDTVVNVSDFPIIENTIVEILGNPFNQHLFLQSTYSQPLDIIIYDVQGKKVYEGALSSSLQLNTTNWQSGVYKLQVLDKGRLLAVEKLLRE